MWIEIGNIGEIVDTSKVCNIYKHQRNGKLLHLCLTYRTGRLTVEFNSESERDAGFDRIKSLLLNNTSGNSIPRGEYV